MFIRTFQCFTSGRPAYSVTDVIMSHCSNASFTQSVRVSFTLVVIWGGGIRRERANRMGLRSAIIRINHPQSNKLKYLLSQVNILLVNPPIFTHLLLNLEHTLNVDNSTETKGNAWGATVPAAWGTSPVTEPQAAWPAQEAFPVAEHQAETWPAQRTFPDVEPQVETWSQNQNGEAWGTAEALLQPPLAQKNLPTIPERPPPGNFVQNRALSEIEESPDEYDESWHRSESNSSHHSESQTVTAAAPSFIGSPTAPQEQSTSVLQEAMKKILTQGTSTASEAARKMEKAKAVQFREPVINAQVEKPDPHQGSSSASAAAAAAEFSMKQTQASNPGKKASNSKTIPWTHPKEFKPGARPPAPLPVDPSWISTGGNAWSNKHRNGFRNSSWSPGNEHLQHLPQPQFQQHPQFQQQSQFQQLPQFPPQSQFQPPQFQPPQFQQQSQFQQSPQFPQQPQFQQPQFQQHSLHTPQARPQAHQRHHSHSTQPQMQPIRPLHKVQTKDHRDWQDWGKGRRAQSTETESDDETATEHEGNQWGRGDIWSQNQKAGGEWDQGVAGGWGQNSWGQNQNAAGGWAQNSWGQNQNAAGGRGQNTSEGRGQRIGGQGAAEAWGGQGTGDAWDQSASGWAQGHTNLKKDDRKRKSQPKKGGDEWERDQHTNHQSGQGGDTWDQGASAWGQDTKLRGDQGGDTWGQDTNHQGGQGGDAWGQDNHLGGQSGDTWGQDTNHQGGQGDDVWGQGASAWQDTSDNRKLEGEWAGGASSHTAWGDEAQRLRLPKVTVTAASEAVGSRNVLSGQQRSQILSNLLNETQTQSIKGAQLAIKHGPQKKAEHEHWSAWEARDHGWGSEDEDDMDDTRRVRFSPKASELWGESPRSIPSKTLARAQQGMTTTPVNDPNNVRFVESKGAAFEYVTNAFFGNSRLARERIHWLFPSDKDPRVAAMLAWVQKLSYNLGTFGVRSFTSVLLFTLLTVANPS